MDFSAYFSMSLVDFVGKVEGTSEFEEQVKNWKQILVLKPK